MAYVKKADRKVDLTPEPTISNLTGIEALDTVLTPEEMIHCNALARVFVNTLQTEKGSKRLRVGNYQGLLELGLNHPGKIATVLHDILRGEDEVEALQAEKLLVAHGYRTAFGQH